MAINRFFLIQRLSPARHIDPTRGFDGLFQCEYMGRAEFEWGAIPDSLKRLRDAKRGITTTEFQYGSQTVYLVHAASNTTVSDTFMGWLTSPGDNCALHEKEPTYFLDILSGRRREFCDTVAWWDLNLDVMFTLDPVHAANLVAGIRNKPAKVG